jgi:hypothetical protein
MEIDMKNVDSFFAIAKGHYVCQDYCYIGNIPHNCMIISDGCSTSNDTDVGSRIITLSAYRCLKDYYSSTRTGIPNYTELGFNIIQKSYDIANIMGMRRSCLNATLMIAIEYEDEINVLMYGDGYLIFKETNGTVKHKYLKYANNAPYYLSYWGNANEHDSFLSFNKQEKDLLTLSEFDGNITTEFIFPYNKPMVFKFDKTMLSWISLLSDGIESFTFVNELGAKERVPTMGVIDKLTSFKNFEGEFVKRRVKRALKDMEKDMIFHEDDLSVAVMLLN